MADTGWVPDAHQQITIKVVDRDGWEKEYPFQKSIVHIGSNPRSDLFLEPGRGAGVALLHAQLIASTAKSGCQLVNLGDTDILLGLSGDQTLPPRSVTGITNETAIRLGEFALTFYTGEDGGEDALGSSAGASQNIGLNISLPQTQLAVNKSLSGTIMVSNLGEQAGVQFDLELEGLDSDCYDIEPAPLLSSGAEKDVVFHIYHRGNKPLAGDCRITISAVAPQAYPGERAIVSHTVQVLPLYHHELRLVVPGKAPPALQAADALKEDALEPEQVEEPESQVPISDAVLPSQTEEWWSVIPEETVPALPEDAEQLLQVEEPTPALEEIDEEMDEEIELLPEAELDPSSQPEEQQLAQLEETVPPDTKVASQPVAEEKESQVEVSLPVQVEEEPVSETEVEPVAMAEIVPPPVAEDWWSSEAEAVAEEEREEPEADSSSRAQAEPAPTDEADPLSSAEDWWAPEAQVDPEEQAEPQVLKLKASPSPEAEAELATPAKAGPSSSDEDWWSAEAAGDSQVEDQAVLKLEASPAPQADVEPAQVTDGPPSVTEDWWSAEGQEGSE
jgi:hypothetical protein